MTANKAIILAAGEGSRMHPLTFTRPKVMLPIAGKPILEHMLIAMLQAGIKEFVFVVGYHDEQIRDYFGDGSAWNTSIYYSNQRKQLGTADAVRMVSDFVTGDFLVANGDIVMETQDIANLIKISGNALSAVELVDVSGLGVVEIEDNLVIHLHEKTADPPTHLANAGLYAFSPAIFEAIERTPRSIRGEFELTDSIQILINSGHKVACNRIQNWLDLSYPWHLLNANETIMSTLEPQCAGEIEPNVVIKGAVSIGSRTIIRSGAYIVGPVMIGRNCDIGPNCYIRPSTTIGDNCHIGAAVEVKNSIVMAGTKIPHFNYVGDSILGQNCNLGAGTKIANLKFDKSNIIVSDIDTGRRKLGAIFGDKVETGINASINVGTLIGNNSFIGPGALAKGVIKPGSRVF
jgi:UDP-N-acetylglucosamine diphosphorylase/glucosamine-1-phosphate N-acetyltransferase